MTDWTGENLKLKLIGASHADFVGAILSGIGKGEKNRHRNAERACGVASSG